MQIPAQAVHYDGGYAAQNHGGFDGVVEAEDAGQWGGEPDSNW